LIGLVLRKKLGQTSNADEANKVTNERKRGLRRPRKESGLHYSKASMQKMFEEVLQREILWKP